MFHNVKIMVVDDELVNLILIEELLKQEGYTNFKIFSDSREALTYAQNNSVEALIIDYNMPHIDGIKLFQKIKTIHHDIVSIMITANHDEVIMKEALEVGITEFLLKPIFPLIFKLRLRNILELSSSLVISKNFNLLLKEKIKEATKALQQSEDEALEVLSKAAEYKDPETASHIARVSHYAKLIAQKYGLDEEEQNIIFYAAPLHDIGKIGITDNILLKEGKLTEKEFEIMKRHSMIGAEILSGKTNTYLNAGELIAMTHHEKYDGSGYPKGLKADAIPLYGRIVAIADVFDALTSDRPYKKAWSFEKAKKLLIEEKDRHFDARLVDIFMESIDEVKKVYNEFQE